MDDLDSYFNEEAREARQARRRKQLEDLGVDPNRLDEIERKFSRQAEEGGLEGAGAVLASAFGHPKVYKDAIQISELHEPALRGLLEVAENGDFSTEGVVLGLMMNVVILAKASNYGDDEVLNLASRVLQMTGTFEQAMEGIGERPWEHPDK